MILKFGLGHVDMTVKETVFEGSLIKLEVHNIGCWRISCDEKLCGHSLFNWESGTMVPCGKVFSVAVVAEGTIQVCKAWVTCDITLLFCRGR